LGVTLTGGVLAAAMAESATSAQMPKALVWSTAYTATRIVSGHSVAAASVPAVELMRGVMKAMLLKKLAVLVVGVVVATTALGVAGVGFRVAGLGGAAQAAPPDKPLSEVEALRKEVELLKLNLQIVLEKVRSQENELKTMRKQTARSEAVRSEAVDLTVRLPKEQAEVALDRVVADLDPLLAVKKVTPDATREVEDAVKALREARDKEGKRRAAEALEKAMIKLKEQLK
jgi:hypothetical protein